jgi:hypothetical protein
MSCFAAGEAIPFTLGWLVVIPLVSFLETSSIKNGIRIFFMESSPLSMASVSILFKLWRLADIASKYVSVSFEG